MSKNALHLEKMIAPPTCPSPPTAATPPPSPPQVGVSVQGSPISLPRAGRTTNSDTPKSSRVDEWKIQFRSCDCAFCPKVTPTTSGPTELSEKINRIQRQQMSEAIREELNRLVQEGYGCEQFDIGTSDEPDEVNTVTEDSPSNQSNEESHESSDAGSDCSDAEENVEVEESQSTTKDQAVAIYPTREAIDKGS